MTTISLQEAQAKLSEIVRQLSPGNDVVITDDNQPIARLSSPASSRSSSVADEDDWWSVLQRIEADQKRRGFVGAASDMDRRDDGYDARMHEIYRNTTSGHGNG